MIDTKSAISLLWMMMMMNMLRTHHLQILNSFCLFRKIWLRDLYFRCFCFSWAQFCVCVFYFIIWFLKFMILLASFLYSMVFFFQFDELDFFMAIIEFDGHFMGISASIERIMCAYILLLLFFSIWMNSIAIFWLKIFPRLILIEMWWWWHRWRCCWWWWWR